jgi:hypothetical protein
VLAAILGVMAPHLSRIAPQTSRSSYVALRRNPVFLRYALSQAFTLGGHLVFVLGAPAVMNGTMRGQLSDFIPASDGHRILHPGRKPDGAVYTAPRR